jgi:hypothetical protein
MDRWSPVIGHLSTRIRRSMHTYFPLVPGTSSASSTVQVRSFFPSLQSFHRRYSTCGRPSVGPTRSLLKRNLSRGFKILGAYCFFDYVLQTDFLASSFKKRCIFSISVFLSKEYGKRTSKEQTCKPIRRRREWNRFFPTFPLLDA